MSTGGGRTERGYALPPVCSGCGTRVESSSVLAWPDGVLTAICRSCARAVVVPSAGHGRPQRGGADS